MATTVLVDSRPHEHSPIRDCRWTVHYGGQPWASSRSSDLGTGATAKDWTETFALAGRKSAPAETGPSRRLAPKDRCNHKAIATCQVAAPGRPLPLRTNSPSRPRAGAQLSGFATTKPTPEDAALCVLRADVIQGQHDWHRRSDVAGTYARVVGAGRGIPKCARTLPMSVANAESTCSTQHAPTAPALNMRPPCGRSQ